MKVLFDTSVLVTAVVDQVPNHAAARGCYRRFAQPRRGGPTAICATHAWAECDATLPALLLPRRIQPAEATRLIEENFFKHLEAIPLTVADDKKALARVVFLGPRRTLKKGGFLAKHGPRYRLPLKIGKPKRCGQ